MKITENTTLAEILEKPELVKILVKYNLPCLSCPFAKMEMENLKIGEICQMYDIDVEKLLKELNSSVDRE
jgi:hybrid cluster-associated redox disulfide protein